MAPKVVFASALLAVVFPAAASASVFVLGGGGFADVCSRYAIEGRSDESSLKTCSVALESETLVKRDRAGTLVNRGVIQLRRKDYAAASADFDAAIALQPKMGEAFVNRGAVLIAQRRWREGVEEIDKGLALGADEPEKAYYNRALAFEALDEVEAAWRDYMKAAELKPEWDAPRRELARFTVTPRP